MTDYPEEKIYRIIYNALKEVIDPMYHADQAGMTKIALAIQYAVTDEEALIEFSRIRSPARRIAPERVKVI